MIIGNLCSLSDQIVMETIQANPVSGNDAMDQSSDSTLVEPQTNSKTPRRIEEKEYFCSQCHVSFKSAKLLRKHFLSHTTSLEMPFKCSTCGEGFCDLLSKRKHLSKHRVERKFKCNGCVRSFYQMSALEKHSCRGFGRLNQTTKEHDDAPRPFKCNQCNKTFARKDTLTNHLPIHSKVKQFRCDLCQRQYTQRIMTDNTHKVKRLAIRNAFNDQRMIRGTVVRFVASVCPLWAPLIYTKGFTLAKSHTDVKSVEDALLKARHLLVT